MLLHYKRLTKHSKTHYLPTTAYSKTVTQITCHICTRGKQITHIKYTYIHAYINKVIHTHTHIYVFINLCICMRMYAKIL